MSQLSATRSTAPARRRPRRRRRPRGRRLLLLELPIALMNERFEQAIPRRMGVDLPPTA